MLFMGIDIGTQGARTVVIDTSGKIAANQSVAFSSINAAVLPDHYEQDADDWWRAASQTISSCVHQLKDRGYQVCDILSICVDGTSGTIVPLDHTYRPLCNAFMYNDMRAKKQAETIHFFLQNTEKKLGYRFNASFALPRILYIRENMPEIYEKTAVFSHQTDYIIGKLCSEYCISDYSNALKTGYDLIEQRWPEALEEAGIDEVKLPRIVAPGTRIGQISARTARELGLSVHTQVVAGSTDGYASALAAGAVKTGDWASIIGTTLVLKGVTKNLIIDPSGSSYSHRLPDGSWMPGGASNIGGHCLNRNFDPSEFDSLGAKADRITPTGIISYPLTGKGERFPFVDPCAEAFMIGEIPDRETLFAAFMEGVGFAERLCFERMEALGCEVGPVIYTSGGACKSVPWLRIRASILNRQLKVPENVDAAMGSALLAAMHEFKTLPDAAAAMIRIRETIDPDPVKVPVYEELYRKFELECRQRFALGDWNTGISTNRRAHDEHL